MNRRVKLSEEDIKLFRKSVEGVKRLKQDRVAPHPARLPAVPLQRLKDNQAVLKDLLSDDLDLSELETGDELIFYRPGLQRSLFKKLRRGLFSMEAELDLHGLRVREARLALTKFLALCRHSGRRCVRIVHGKGHGSFNKQPVLKLKLNRWLRQCGEVLAFCSARQVDGGTGAVYVLLKRG